MAYDIKITGGTIVDGSGEAGYIGDVGIRDGVVVALGDAPESAEKTIDASGKVVCPGFVDIHTHYDAQIVWDKMLTISPWHGVTTVVTGNCGFGVAPTRPEHRQLIVETLEKVEGMTAEALNEGLGGSWPFETFPEYLDAIEAGGSAINVAVMIGHTPLRLYVMGEECTERFSTPEELDSMKGIVRDALEAGAIGFATSNATTHTGYRGKPVPSRAASIDEIENLASAVGDIGHGVIQATIGPALAMDQFEKISKDNNANVSWTALLGGGGLFPMGSSPDQLKRSAEILEGGAKVYPQVTCRPLNFEFTMREPFIFEMHPMFKSLGGATSEERVAAYQKAEFRAEFKEMLNKDRVANAWKNAAISYCQSNPEYEERLIIDIAAEKGISSADFALDLAIADNLDTRIRLPIANVDEDEVGVLLSDPNVVLGLSDAGAHASQLCDACYSTHLLGQWVREKGVLKLERAIHMLTQRPAEIFGISDRGLLAVDRPADVVVLDASEVGCGQLERVWDQPSGADRLISYASGIEAVIVNGELLRYHNEDQLTAQDSLPGKLLRHGHAAQ